MKTRTSDEILTGRFLLTQQVTVSWIYADEEGYLYDNVEASIVANSKEQSVRFKLQEKNDHDESFEVLIWKSNDSFYFKADHHQLVGHDYPLKVCVASDELVFNFEDRYNRAYFHLS